jgi:hypothetical protein
MPDLTAQRTLVKSPPELWSELSEVESLARHLGELGEIRITRVEPETAVAWEGEDVRGTVELEESGWGTKVTFHATVPEPDATVPVEPEPQPQPESEPAPEPDTVVEAAPRGFWARWLFRERRSKAVEPQPPVEPESIAPEPVAAEPKPEAGNGSVERVQAVLDGTLEALGQAHHRPFSRG